MILQALDKAYDRFSRQELANGKPRVPPYGYSYERISYALVLDEAGKLLDVEVVDAGELDVPSDPTITRTSAIEPMFLWDKTAYALGLAPVVKKRTADEHDAFKKHQCELIGESDDAGLRALLGFLYAWGPSPDSLPRYRDELIGTNVVFRLDGEVGYLHDRPAAREVWLRHLRGKPAHTGHCLIRGERARISLTHPTLGGVRGAQSSGAAIVSFNQEAFRSYGKDQGANAPVSEHAAFAYTTALNDLLRKDGPQKVQIGDATTVYWAEAAEENAAAAAEKAFGWLSQPPSQEQLNTGETDRLRTEVMDRVAEGRPLENPELNLKKDTRFYILGLSPNAARLSVRFWEATTLGKIGEAFHQHWQDLNIEPQPWRQPPAIWRLLTRTAPARRNQKGVAKYDTKQIPPNLAGELMRAILSGRPYPRTILSNALMRFRCDHVIDGLRVALVKAAIVRGMRMRDSDLPKEAYVSLNHDDPDAAYRLGRLFALLEKAQLASIDGINTTICDRYYGAAAATPARVFGFLIKNSKNHLATLRKGRGAKWVRNPAATGGWLDREIGAIHGGFSGSFPPSLTLEEQGRFSIGYYHQKYARREDLPDDLKADIPEAGSDDTEGDSND
ncbi:MAG: type I-C CRISPR-associated protein Cas8c/Csd1 [Hyphomicrobiaceae bacterium]|nr:MAG: type I-C CRISPR-associated protein Cas8c/Csd1 [Hyphomicrobiaceae bacterium]